MGKNPKKYWLLCDPYVSICLPAGAGKAFGDAGTVWFKKKL
jgi:hypothetical protein